MGDNCRCTRYASLGSSCGNTATQEDLLCDDCRGGGCDLVLKPGSREVHERSPRGPSGVPAWLEEAILSQRTPGIVSAYGRDRDGTL